AVDGFELALEVRHHEARNHFVAAPHLLARRPVVGKGENCAEPARQLLELSELDDGIFGGAEDAAAEFIHELRRRVTILVNLAIGTPEFPDAVFFVPALGAVCDSAPRLLAQPRERNRTREAPFCGTAPPAVFLGRGLGKTPLRLKRGESRL